MTDKNLPPRPIWKKKISWEKLSDNAYAYTAEGDPNTGVIIGDDGCMIIDATATPVAAQGVIAKIREITDKPIKYVVLTHYHAVRVLGASGLQNGRLEQIIASRDTYDLIVERGQQDMDSEIGRFPRLFQAVESVPGLTWPTMTFEGEMTLWLGKLEVKSSNGPRPHQGRHHRHLPSQNICFSGDLVEADAACYTGDAYLADWPQTLDNLAAMKFDKLVPGRGPALMTPAVTCKRAWPIRATLSPRCTKSAQEAVAQGMDLNATMKHTRKAMDPSLAPSSSTSTACRLT